MCERMDWEPELQDLVGKDPVLPKVQVKGEKTSVMRIIDKAIYRDESNM